LQVRESSIGDLLEHAQRELYAARFQNAAALYSRVLARDPAHVEAYYGLVRALITVHRNKEAYSVAGDALAKHPESAAVQASAGLAAYRHGDLPAAERHFRDALKLDPDYPGALKGLASIYSVVSKFKSARELVARAYGSCPDDPDLMMAHANTLKGADHIAALEQILAIVDPASEEARSLRAHIADDRALGDRRTRRLLSPYAPGKIKLFRLLDSAFRLRGFGLRAELNRRETVRLLLDTGASGISLSPKVAAKAGLETLGGESSQARGLGDNPAQAATRYLASEIRLGDLVFSDFPVSVFASAQSAGYDGIIGADVFQRFIVSIDFPRLEILLEPRPIDASSASEEAADAGAPAPGFHRLFRFGNHLALPTSVNEGKSSLFLIDSGSAVSLIDTEIAQASAKVYDDGQSTLQGVQGKVNQTLLADHVSLVFAGFRQDNPSLISISLDKMSDSLGVAFGGILGIPVLRNMKLSIDYREGTVRFEYEK
jgi:thioredoxin-like negative regulator of GroEL